MRLPQNGLVLRTHPNPKSVLHLPTKKRTGFRPRPFSSQAVSHRPCKRSLRQAASAAAPAAGRPPPPAPAPCPGSWASRRTVAGPVETGWLTCPKRDPELKGDHLFGPLLKLDHKGETKGSDQVDSLGATEVRSLRADLSFCRVFFKPGEASPKKKRVRRRTRPEHLGLSPLCSVCFCFVGLALPTKKNKKRWKGTKVNPGKKKNPWLIQRGGVPF